jgi:hypothetical protein
MLRDQGVDCEGLVGIGIAFIHDSELGKFIISQSVIGGAAHGKSNYVCRYRHCTTPPLDRD